MVLDGHRGKQWIEWGERHDHTRERSTEQYRAFITHPRNTAADLEQINKDVGRTYPEVADFKDPDTQEVLRRVLQAVAFHNPAGYSQVRLERAGRLAIMSILRGVAGHELRSRIDNHLSAPLSRRVRGRDILAYDGGLPPPPWYRHPGLYSIISSLVIGYYDRYLTGAQADSRVLTELLGQGYTRRAARGMFNLGCQSVHHVRKPLKEMDSLLSTLAPTLNTERRL